jgi:hypothetical protein
MLPHDNNQPGAKNNGNEWSDFNFFYGMTLPCHGANGCLSLETASKQGALLGAEIAYMNLSKFWHPLTPNLPLHTILTLQLPLCA